MKSTHRAKIVGSLTALAAYWDAAAQTDDAELAAFCAEQAAAAHSALDGQTAALADEQAAEAANG